MGIAFVNEHSAWVSEGNSGKIALFDWNGPAPNGRRRAIDLNQKGFDDSYTGDLALDAERGILYVVDQANFRIAVIDTRSRQVVASVKVGRLPFAMALSPDRRKLYVTNLGMFEYQAVPGADMKQAGILGCPFPPSDFPAPKPSPEWSVPPSVGRSRSPASAIRTSANPTPSAWLTSRTPARQGGGVRPHGPAVRAGCARRKQSLGNPGRGGAGVRLQCQRRYHHGHRRQDRHRWKPRSRFASPAWSVTAAILPIGLAYHEKSGWLLVAEAGINAVGVIDVRQRRVLGHIPAAWFPTRVALDRDTVFVANGRGFGQGPNALRGTCRGMGSVSVYPLPDAARSGGRDCVRDGGQRLPPLPRAERRRCPPASSHVVLIVKENRTYDEVFGDIAGRHGPMGRRDCALRDPGVRGRQAGRLSIRDINVTPNHHAIAGQWAISDNFYTDSDVSVDGHHWLVGSYPNAWTESSLMAAYSEQKKDFRLTAAPGRLLFAGSDSSVHPEEQLENGTIWHHLDRHHITFRNFGEGFELAGVDEGKGLEPTGARFLTNIPMPDPLYRNTSRTYPGFNMNVPDQFRATQFIKEMEGMALPQFVFIHLPNDHTAEARPADGYPYSESFVADNDYALGRIVEYLSGRKEWGETAILVTEDDAQSGVDHIDAHRTVFMAIGPWIRQNYVSHVNTSFPGLLKTIFRLLGIPPLNLYDATASDLSDVFSTKPNPAVYKGLPVDQRIFDPATARQSTSGKPGPRMDRQ